MKRAKAEEEQRMKAEVEAKAKAEEEARLHAKAEAQAKAEEEERARLKAEEEARLKVEAEKAERLRAIYEAKARAHEEQRKEKELEKAATTEKTPEPSHPSRDVDISFLQSSESEGEDNVPLAKRRMDKGKQILSDNDTSESSNGGPEESKHPTASEAQEHRPTEGQEALGFEFNIHEEEDVDTEEKKRPKSCNPKHKQPPSTTPP